MCSNKEEQKNNVSLMFKLKKVGIFFFFTNHFVDDPPVRVPFGPTDVEVPNLYFKIR